MRRIMIIGAPGSGKSTLARMVGARLDLPVIHMDHIHHLPGWRPRPHPEKVEMVTEVVAREDWVFEGGMSSTYGLRADRAEQVVLLDFPLVQRLFRVLRRTVNHYGQTRPDMQQDCPERFSAEFLWWIVSTARRNRARDRAFIASLPTEKTRTLRRRSEVGGYLETLAP